LRYRFPLIYSLAAGAAWIHFLTLSRDGLASALLMIMILPITIIDRVLSQLIRGKMDHFLFAELAHLIGLPKGYVLDHAYFYFPSVALIAEILYLIGKKRS
jgi:hypothetical protein